MNCCPLSYGELARILSIAPRPWFDEQGRARWAIWDTAQERQAWEPAHLVNVLRVLAEKEENEAAGLRELAQDVEQRPYAVSHIMTSERGSHVHWYTKELLDKLRLPLAKGAYERALDLRARVQRRVARLLARRALS